MTIDLLKDWIGTILVWIVLLILLLFWPFTEFARSMATNPASVPMCLKCAIISISTAIYLLYLFWS